MSFERDLVDRAVQVLAPEGPSFEGLLRRRDRKRRNQRLAAGAVGLAIGIAVMLIGSAYLRSARHETAEWPEPSITSTRIVRSGEVLLDPSPTANPTYVIAADVSTRSQRTVAGCEDGCRLLTPFEASADGGWIAYHLVTCGEGECRPSDAAGGLWVVGADAPPRLVLATPPVLAGGVDAPWSWSPTGAQLAYADVDELILLDPTTWERTTITTAGGTISRISWGPDGRSIAYSVVPPSAGTGDDASSGVFVVRSGREPHRVSDGLGTFGIGWSPDGRSLVLERFESGRSMIEVMAADGSENRVLVEGSALEEPGAPVWSPDGSRIAFIRRSSGGLSVEIWVIGVDGQGDVRLGIATGGSWQEGPVWSPDSQRVAWSSVAPGRWVATDAEGSGSAEPIDRLEAERWRQG